MSVIKPTQLPGGLTMSVLVLLLAIGAVTGQTGAAQSATPKLTAVLVCEAGTAGSAQLNLTSSGTDDTARLSLSCSASRPVSTEVALTLPEDGLSWSASVTARMDDERETCEGQGARLPVIVRCEVAGVAVILRAPNRDLPGTVECQGEARSLAALREVAGTPVAAEAPQLPVDMPFPFGDEPAD